MKTRGNVVVLLDHGRIDEDSQLFELFIKRIRKVLSFRYNCHLGKSGCRGTGANQFDCPWDVKISRTHRCILVTDRFNNRIQVFDLDSKRLKVSIATNDAPLFMDVEEKGCSAGDALIYSTGAEIVVKIDLKQAISRKGSFGLWTSDYVEGAKGLAVYYGEKKRTVFVCASTSNCIHVLDCYTGKIIKKIGLSWATDNEFRLRSPFSLTFGENGKLLIITQLHSHEVLLLYKFGDEWLPSKTLRKGQALLDLRTPRGISSNSNYIFICDEGSNRIQVCTVFGDFVTSFGSLGQGSKHLNHPFGVCMDNVSDQLFVADTFNHRIVVLS